MSNGNGRMPTYLNQRDATNAALQLAVQHEQRLFELSLTIEWAVDKQQREARGELVPAVGRLRCGDEGCEACRAEAVAVVA